MDEESVDIQIASSSKESNLSRNKGIDYDTGIRHIIAPALIGLVLGIFFQEIIFEKYGWPSPPQGAILVSVLISPLLYIVLVRDEFSRWYEYTLGLCVPGMIFFVMWFSEWGALFCGGYGALLPLGWVSTDLGRDGFPPFWYGGLHLFAIDIGAFFVALLSFCFGL